MRLVVAPADQENEVERADDVVKLVSPSYVPVQVVVLEGVDEDRG